MSVLFRRVERRSSAMDAPIEYRGPYSGPGQLDAALRLTPVYSSVSLIAEALISTPLHAYRQASAGSAQVSPDPPVIADPSLSVDRLTWRGQYVASMLLRGNAYGLTVETGSNGLPSRVEWLHPDSVTVVTKVGRPRYFRDSKELDPAAVMHIRSLTLPGAVVGLSAVELFRAQFDAAAAAAELQANTYRSGGPASHLKNVSKVLQAGEAEAIEARFRARMKSGGVLVTGSDWDYKQLGLSPSDAQFIEAAKLSANQIAAIFHVPPDEIGGETGSSLTYSTLEMNDLKFIRRAVLPLAIRLEAALSRALPKPQYVKFNLSSYVRTDLMTRMRAHALALAYGIETNGEVRALEDRPPLTDDEIAAWQAQYKNHAADPTAGIDAGRAVTA